MGVDFVAECVKVCNDNSFSTYIGIESNECRAIVINGREVKLKSFDCRFHYIQTLIKLVRSYISEISLLIDINLNWWDNLFTGYYANEEIDPDNSNITPPREIIKSLNDIWKILEDNREEIHYDRYYVRYYPADLHFKWIRDGMNDLCEFAILNNYQIFTYQS